MTLKAETQGHHLDFARTVTKSSWKEFPTPFDLWVLSSPFIFIVANLGLAAIKKTK